MMTKNEIQNEKNYIKEQFSTYTREDFTEEDLAVYDDVKNHPENLMKVYSQIEANKKAIAEYEASKNDLDKFFRESYDAYTEGGETDVPQEGRPIVELHQKLLTQYSEALHAKNAVLANEADVKNLKEELEQSKQVTAKLIKEMEAHIASELDVSALNQIDEKEYARSKEPVKAEYEKKKEEYAGAKAEEERVKTHQASLEKEMKDIDTSIEAMKADHTAKYSNAVYNDTLARREEVMCQLAMIPAVLAQIQETIISLEKEVSVLYDKVNDTSALEAKKKENLDNAKARVEDYKKMMAPKVQESEEATKNLEKKIEAEEAKKPGLAAKAKDSEKVCKILEEEKKKLALEEINKKINSLKEENEKLSDKTGKTNDIFTDINSKLIQKNVHGNERFLDGLNAVKRVYDSYHKSHWGITRWLFKNNTSFSVGQDYAAYKEVRDLYAEKSGISVADINEYLDHGTLKGSLAPYANPAEVQVNEAPKEQVNVDLEDNENPYKAEIENANENVKEDVLDFVKA